MNLREGNFEGAQRGRVESAFVFFSTTPVVATHTRRYTVVSAAHVLFSVQFKYTIVLVLAATKNYPHAPGKNLPLCVQLFELIATRENLSNPCQTALLAARARQKFVRFWVKIINRKIGNF